MMKMKAENKLQGIKIKTNWSKQISLETELIIGI